MSTTSKRIAIAFRGIGDIGGTNNTITDHARYFCKLGHQVDLIGGKVHKGGVTPDMGRAVRIQRLPVLSRYKWRWFAARAQQYIDQQNYDFVAGHGHHYRQDVLSMHNCLHLAHELLHGDALDARGTLAEIHDRIFAEDGFKLCICNSRLMRDDLSQRYGVDPERLPVIYPGYRPAQFNRGDRQRYRDAVREELGCDEHTTLIGLITSGDYQKRGLDILLHAYATLEDGLRQSSMLLVLGKQASSSFFMAEARALGIADRMRFVPHTLSPQRYFHALDICAHPARIEEFGQVVQEAFACGVPVVTSKRVGATELLPKNLYDALPEAPSAANISAQLERLIRNEPERRAIAEQMIEQVRCNTAEANFNATLAVYRRAGLDIELPATAG
ncbi:group 1 glycosyl transferase [Salinisphaera sp. S4-8]|uniref:glycosyltransferase family 4 protein n=1 Tax=Salinisphaera sp. S4-8 TaxID=633357 RepID=UPI0033412E72